ncbi:MAG: type II secretion system F family protein [Thermoplasmata archaeon]|nr:type II secretion system F family protein [Thermoplasmata archaeon]
MITPISPTPNSTVYTLQPVIKAAYTDSGSAIDQGGVLLFVNGLNVTAVENVTITATDVTYPVSSLLKLKEGNASVTVIVSDLSHHRASFSWNFTVNTTATLTSPIFTLPTHSLVLYLGLGGLIAGAGTGSYVLYLRRTHHFTFARYFATHPVQNRYVVVYAPAVAAFIFLLSALDFVYNTPRLPSRSPDYVIVITLFIGLVPLAVDSRRKMRRLRTFERAFAQFLFESADAIRGGLDPAKAVVELAKTHTDILQKPLRAAADGIRVGRPFDQVIREMAAPMKSKLISRYAGLIADAATIGGETSIVVHRAAKDMDDFIKIEIERSNLLTLPVAVVYIAFAVLMAVLFALLSIAPSIGTINISILGGNVLNGAASAPLPRLSSALLGERFFELMLINSLGTGAIIGAFTEGKARYGLVHSLALVAATTVAFAILFP